MLMLGPFALHIVDVHWHMLVLGLGPLVMTIAMSISTMGTMWQGKCTIICELLQPDDPLHEATWFVEGVRIFFKNLYLNCGFKTMDEMVKQFIIHDLGKFLHATFNCVNVGRNSLGLYTLGQ